MFTHSLFGKYNIMVRISEIITEKRRNSEQNPKMTIYDFLSQYKDDPTMYLHTGPLQKVGVYPKSSFGHDSPLGIYAFRLVDLWEKSSLSEVEPEIINNKFIRYLPYYGGEHLFILQSFIDTDFPNDYTKNDLEQDVLKLKELYHLDDKRIKRLYQAAKTNQNFRDCPAGYLWGITKAFVAGVDTFDDYTPVNTRKWNNVLRNLGYIGFNDRGMGIIHGAEHFQAVFLTSAAYRIIDHILLPGARNSSTKNITIDNDTYKGIGRVPKDLVMNNIPNVLFYNNSPEDFKKVRTWTVKNINQNDFERFCDFLPWNAKGYIDNLFITSTSPLMVGDFLNKKVPSRIKINKISLHMEMPMLMLRRFPLDYPVNEIVVNKNIYGFSDLPDEIKSKIRMV